MYGIRQEVEGDELEAGKMDLSDSEGQSLIAGWTKTSPKIGGIVGCYWYAVVNLIIKMQFSLCVVLWICSDHADARPLPKIPAMGTWMAWSNDSWFFTHLHAFVCVWDTKGFKGSFNSNCGRGFGAMSFSNFSSNLSYRNSVRIKAKELSKAGRNWWKENR